MVASSDIGVRVRIVVETPSGRHDGGWVHRHRTAVCGDHERVGDDAQRDQPESGDPAICKAERDQESVRSELDPLDLTLAEDANRAERDDLSSQSGVEQRPPAESQKC
jgi:hypothetical protein